jgi:hypothetical protein
MIEKTYREEWSQDLTVPCKSRMVLEKFYKKCLYQSTSILKLKVKKLVIRQFFWYRQIDSYTTPFDGDGRMPFVPTLLF